MRNCDLQRTDPGRLDPVSDTPAWNYRAPWWLPGGHAQTLLPALMRSGRDPGYVRERIKLPDGDFVDLDWLTRSAPDLVILTHGLEGSSNSPYMRRMARALRRVNPGPDILAMNLRGCSGETNRSHRFYHSGETEDLRFVIEHVAQRYDRLALVGFSLGGNMILKYLGKAPDRVHPRITASVAFSVPCHLASSAEVLARPGNRIYMFRFLRSLTAKVRDLERRHPGTIDLSGLKDMRTFAEFDHRFTAPLHGFKGADDYWTRSSSRQFLSAIRVPTLLVNARNDPFLSPECFPEMKDIGNPMVTAEYPSTGGHIGFPGSRESGMGWKETRVLLFLQSIVQRTTPI